MKKLKIILFAIMCVMFSLSIACTNSCGQQESVDDTGVTTFSLKEYSFNLYVGDSRTIEVLSEEELSYKFVSSREDVVSVNDNGLVTALREGVAFINVTSGDLTDTLRVTVSENKKYISFDTEDTNMVVSSTKDITAVVYNKGLPMDVVVTWTVSPDCKHEINGNVITLNPQNNGRITVTATYGDLTNSCEIKIVNDSAVALKTPVVSATNCNQVVWDVVSGADAYGVNLNGGGWYDVTENFLDISELSSNLLDGESIRIAVRAKANENFDYIDSNFSVIMVKHDFTKTSVGEVPYSCTVAGTIKYDCKNCDREYTVENYVDEHNFVDGKCVDCKKVQSENVIYVYDADLDVYALNGVQANYSSEELYALAEYDDGIHGLKPVTYITKSAFSQNTLIKKIVLPTSITTLKGGCFSRMANLEYLAMPGIVSPNSSSLSDNWMDTYSLKTLIVPDDFNNTSRNFFIHKWSPNEYVPIMDVYVLGDSYTQLAPAGYNYGWCEYGKELDKNGPNYMFTGNVYYYDESGEKCGQFWRYDEDGNPVKNKEHTIRENVCVDCGYIYNKDMVFQYKEKLNAYACKRVRVSTCSDVIVIPETYNDGIHGELPVKIVDNGAFGSAKNVTKVILPMSITKVYGSGFGAPNLEVVIMPGVTAMGDGNDINQFLNCTKLHTIVVAQNANLSWQTFHVEPSKYPSYTALVDVYLYGEENRVTMSDYNNNMFTWNVYCYSEDETRHGTWWKFDEEGNVKKFTNMHAFTNGWCKCGAMDDKGVSYSYSPSMGGYRVIGYFDTFNSQVLNLDYYNDGINGEAPVIAIANNAFKGNSVIKELILSDSITTIQNNAFKGCENLVTVRMPKVTSISSGAFAECTALKNLIVNPDLILSSAVFTGNISTKIPVLSAESGIGSLDLNISANTMLSGAVYAKKLDTMPTLYHGNWWYESNGNFILEEKGAHDFSNGDCVCGAEDPKNFTYSYDPERGGYRIIKATLGEETKLIVTDYDDGVHGELPVVSVAANAFSASEKLTYLRFPIDTVYIGKNAIDKLTALETLIMPGITGSTWQSKTYLSNVRSDVLKHVVLGEGINVTGFSSSDGLFLNSNLVSPAADIAPADPENKYRTADIFVYGEKSGSIDVTNNTAFKVYENKRYGGKAFYYSEEPKAGSWYFDENGIPALWADKTYYVYDETLGGYVLSSFANNDIPEDGRVIIPDTYKDKDGEYPVVAVGASAFGSTDKITYLRFPESVVKIGVDAIAGLSKLETLIMPGMAGSLFKTKAEANFGSDVKSDVLKHVVVSGEFSVTGVTTTQPRFMNSNDSTHDSPDAPKDVENTYRTAEIYYIGTNADGKYNSIDVTNNTAFKVRTNVRYSDCYYVYSEEPKAGFWHYDENGVPAIWEEITYYAYDETLGGYVLSSFAEKDIPEDGRVIIPEKYNGENGEYPVVAVADAVFGSTEKITYLRFPESVVKIGVDAIAGLSKLETLIMPGMTGGLFGAKESLNFGSDVRSDVLKHVVVGVGFSVSGVSETNPRFINSNDNTHDSPDLPKGADNSYRTAELYYYGSEGKNADVTNNTAFKVRTNARYSNCYYTYSATEKVGCWYYDENGVPVLWEDKTVYELNSSEDGYILTHFAEKDAVNGKVVVPATYNDKPVVSVGANAFGSNATVETLILPESVTYIGENALAGLTGLKTLVMPGITSTKNEVFNTSIKSTKLESITAGYGFQIIDAKLDLSGASNKAKIFLVNVPTDYDYKKVIVNAMTQYVKLISGEVYAYDASLGGYVMLSNRVVCETLVVPKKLNDGINGEKDVVKVAAWASYNVTETFLKTVILPETVTAIGYHSFVFHGAITTFVMPGVVGEGDKVFEYSAGSGIDKVNKIVVNKDLGHTVWFGRGNDNVSIFVDGTEFSNTAAGNLGADFTYTIYYRSDTRLSGAWTYVDGIPTLWDYISE